MLPAGRQRPSQHLDLQQTESSSSSTTKAEKQSACWIASGRAFAAISQQLTGAAASAITTRRKSAVAGAATSPCWRPQTPTSDARGRGGRASALASDPEQPDDPICAASPNDLAFAGARRANEDTIDRLRKPVGVTPSRLLAVAVDAFFVRAAIASAALHRSRARPRECRSVSGSVLAPTMSAALAHNTRTASDGPEVRIGISSKPQPFPSKAGA